MSTFDESFAAIEHALADRYGLSQPGSMASASSFEAALEVVLGQYLAPVKTARAIEALRAEGLLDPQALSDEDPIVLLDLLKGVGSAVQPRVAGALLKLANWMAARLGDTEDPLRDVDFLSTEALRTELAGLKGIGQTTADAIALHAGDRSVYPVDRPTYRILIRHGWLDSSADYEEARSVMQRPALDNTPERLKTLSDWFAQLGHDYCKASVPKCDRCPLRPFLPEGGPYDPSEF